MPDKYPKYSEDKKNKINITTYDEHKPSVVPSGDNTKREYKGTKIGEEIAKAVKPSNKFYGKMKIRKGYSGGG